MTVETRPSDLAKTAKNPTEVKVFYRMGSARVGVVLEQNPVTKSWQKKLAEYPEFRNGK